MRYLYIDHSKQMKESILAVLLICLVAFTGGNSAIVNTFFLIISLFGVIVFSDVFGGALFAGSIVYFGYSYIEFNNYISASISCASYTYLLCGTMLLKLMLTKKKILSREMSIGFAFVLFCVWQMICIAQVSLVTGLGSFFVCVYSGKVIAGLKNKDNDSKYFIISLILCLLSTFIYVFLWKDLLSNDLVQGFCGARDGNNFALLCNLCIVLVYYSGIRNKTPLLVILSLCTVTTISMSGFLSLVAILAVMWVNKNRKSISLKIVLGFVAAFLLILCLDPLLSVLSHSSGMVGSIATRVTTIINQLSIGDYQSATTNRTMLWDYYLVRFAIFSPVEKLVGSYQALRVLQTTYYASHNSFIDLLFSSGFIGLISFATVFVVNIRSHIKKDNMERVLFLLIFASNLIFRTMSGFSLLFPVLL